MTTRRPSHYEQIRSRHPAVLEAVETLGKSVKGAGPLEKREAELIQLAAAVAIRSEGAVHSHVKRALEHGASREDVEHAILLLTSTVGFPTVMAALSWAGDVYASGDFR